MRLAGHLVDGFVFGSSILGLECAASVIEGSELDGDTGSNAYQWSDRAFVESGGALVPEDLRGAVQGSFVLCGGLETDLDNVYAGLEYAWRSRAWALPKG